MFDFGAPELLIVLVVVVLLFGPGRLSKIFGEIGEGIRSFKDSISGSDDASESVVEVKADQK